MWVLGECGCRRERMTGERGCDRCVSADVIDVAVDVSVGCESVNEGVMGVFAGVRVYDKCEYGCEHGVTGEDKCE